MENKNYNLGIYDNCFNPVIFDRISQNATCLDVGCWTGNLGKALIENKRCTVDGIDFRQDVLNVAKENGYRETFLINFNNDLPYQIKERYDCIIFADILEHLVNPEKVLRFFRKNLTEDGFFLVSVPNIAFLKQRIDLFLGKFNYNPSGGIMDKTHLRFFTKESIKKLCLKNGFEIVEFQGYSLTRKSLFFLGYLAKIFPSLFSIQFIIKAKPRKNDENKPK